MMKKQQTGLGWLIIAVVDEAGLYFQFCCYGCCCFLQCYVVVMFLSHKCGLEKYRQTATNADTYIARHHSVSLTKTLKK